MKVTPEQRKYLAGWLRKHGGELKGTYGNINDWADYLEKTDVSPDEILRMVGADTNTVLSTMQNPEKVVINGGGIDLSYLPSYSTEATNKYDTAVKDLQRRVENGTYEPSATKPWSYDRTVDDFMDPDLDKQLQVSKDKAFQADWLGGNDYGSIINQSQAATDTYNAAYNKAMDAMNYDQGMAYKVWKDERDQEQAKKTRDYSYDLNTLELLRKEAQDEQETNRLINETLSNWGISYANIAANNGTSGNFFDLLTPETKQRLTGMPTTTGI